MKAQNDEPIKDVLQKMLQDYKLKSRIQQLQIKKLWHELMGASVAKYTTDVVFRRQKLYITISSGALKQELSYSKEKIKNLLNEQMKETAIKEVIIR